MSVGYIQNPEWPVVVADDLESFFHVMLYQSVRYLRHSLASMATDFVKSYFDTFQLRNDGTQLCSNTKIRTVNIGKLEHGGELLECRADGPEYVIFSVRRQTSLQNPCFRH